VYFNGEERSGAEEEGIGNEAREEEPSI